MQNAPADRTMLLMQVMHSVDDAIKEAVRVAVRNAISEATSHLEQRILDGLKRPRIVTKETDAGGLLVEISFRG